MLIIYFRNPLVMLCTETNASFNSFAGHLWMYSMSHLEMIGLQQWKTITLLSARTWSTGLLGRVGNWKNIVSSCESRCLLWNTDGRVRIWCTQPESMDPSSLLSTAQAGPGGVMVWRMCSWHTWALLMPFKHHLNAVHHVHPFMATFNSFSDEYLQKDPVPLCTNSGWIYQLKLILRMIFVTMKLQYYNKGFSHETHPWSLKPIMLIRQQCIWSCKYVKMFLFFINWFMWLG